MTPDTGLNNRTGEGYIILARETYKNSKTWQALNPVQKVIMLTLLMMANHKDAQWWDDWKKEFVSVKRGQLITSLSSLKQACGKGISIQNIRTCFVNLEKMGFLTHHSTKQYTLVTITNYDFYQSQDNYLINQSTKHQHSTNTSLTINKNDKHDKHDKHKDLIPPKSPKSKIKASEPKVKYADFVSLTNAEHSALVAKLGSEYRVKRCVEILDNYKGASGKLYKSDYRAILNWVITRLEEEELRGGQAREQRNILAYKENSPYKNVKRGYRPELLKMQ